jgi:arginyl-tRNA synthetase
VSRSPIPSSVLLPLSGIEAIQSSERISSSAIRFFDLSHKRSSNYAFSPERAMSLKGQSAPYILYAITRLNTLRLQAAAVLGVDVTEAQVDDDTTHKSILDVDKSLKKVSNVWEKLAIASEERICVSKDISNDKSIHEFTLHLAERTLALSLTRLPEAVASAARLLYPHILAEHVLELAAATHVCYDACRVLPPPDAQAEQDWRLSARRLRLLGAADVDIRLCCHLLGVEVVTRM